MVCALSPTTVIASGLSVAPLIRSQFALICVYPPVLPPVGHGLTAATTFDVQPCHFVPYRIISLMPEAVRPLNLPTTISPSYRIIWYSWQEPLHQPFAVAAPHPGDFLSAVILATVHPDSRCRGSRLTFPPDGFSFPAARADATFWRCPKTSNANQSCGR